MSNPYDPHNAPTSFGPSGPPPPPPPQQPGSPPPPPNYPQHPPQGGGYGQGPGGPGYGGAPGGYGGPGGPGGYGGPPPKSKLPLIIGAAVLALVLVVGAVIGGVVLLGGDDDGDDRASDDTSESADPTDDPESPSEEPPASEPVTPETPEAPESSAAPSDPGEFDEALFPVVGFWNGTYICAQGTSSLELVIAPSARGGDSVDGVFTFGPTSANPEVPEGSFLMEGTFTDGVLTLNGTTWVNQPTGYVLIDLVADVEGDQPESISGEITSGGCDSFTVNR